MKILSDCPLCQEHSCHVFEQNETTLMTCLSCGYASSDKFIGDPEINSEYVKLTEEMKSWAKIHDGRIWIPSILTLPEGMIYPVDVDGKMKWAYAEIKPVLETDKESHLDPEGEPYEVFYDTDNATVFDQFYDCFTRLNMAIQNMRMQTDEKSTK